MTSDTTTRSQSGAHNGSARINGLPNPFAPARVTAAFLKMGIMGKQGAGKSKTAAKVAIGLIRHLKKLNVDYASKPIAFFDTEGGSDYLIPDFKKAGIPFIITKQKSFADLLNSLRWAEQTASVLIIDSIVHPYRELIASYLKKKQRTFLQIDDWNYIKGEHGWEQFTTLYINSKLHIVMCGRAADALEQYTDEDGKRQLEKIGTKMKGEAETGFEPSLLVEMRLIESNARQGVVRKRNIINRAMVVKDRWDMINGEEFDNPGFEQFLPHIELLNLGGEHVGIGNGDSQHILKTEKRDWQPVQRKIAIDEIQSLIVMHVPGQAAVDKQRKLALLRTHFNASWTEIEEVMPLPDLRAGYDTLYRELEGKPSKYSVVVAPETHSTEIDDELPDHSAPPSTPSLMDKLRNELTELQTIADCVSWGLAAGSLEGLTDADRIEVATLLLARQNVIGKANAPAVDKPKPKQKPAAKVSAAEALAAG